LLTPKLYDSSIAVKFTSAADVRYVLKGELNLEKNVDLNEYLREIKFCTGQESVDVVQRKKIFNDKNHYLFT